MSILIEKPGILTTVQDLGRHEYRRFGINPGGVMDRTATRLINILLGNDENAAVLEMHFPAPQVAFERNTVFALGGGDFSAMLDSQPVQSWRPILAKKNAHLSFTAKAAGNRGFLTVMGGFRLAKWLDSRSTNLAAGIGGVDGRCLVSGDILTTGSSTSSISNFRSDIISPSLIPRYSQFPTVRIVKGAEFDELNEAGKKTLCEHNFSISNNSNRMGFRLAGEPITFSKPLELLSSAVSFGTVQLLPDGQLIVLMADHQTTGGYPRVGHVISRDLPLMAQLGPGDKVAFHLIDLAEAEALAADFERELSFFRVGCKFQADSWEN
ncbi:MAG: biotin-dependent carboxyltransferase family protein [Pyrinomonadaceae bacterium]